MEAAIVNLKNHTHGDTWEGITIGPILIDGLPPLSPVSSCRIQFRLKNTGELGYELNESPAAGEGNITIDNPNSWLFTVPEQFLIMNAGKYEWDFETIDSTGKTLTFYKGDFELTQDTSRD